MVEVFLVVAIVTILLTRLYLALTGYPQVGGGTLHIAHALYGGVLMMSALLVGWLFLGGVARAAMVVLGGIGFGLFLDEVGKFVTVDNDYFFGPSAEIMYVCVVVVLVINRVLRDARRPDADECLANAATMAAEGAARGLAPGRRATAILLLDSAAAHGADVDAVRGTRLLIEAADHRVDRLQAMRELGTRMVPGIFRSPRWVPLVGVVMVIGSMISVAAGAAQFIGIHVESPIADPLNAVGTMGLADGALFGSAAITLALALPATVRLLRRRSVGAPLWPLRTLRLAAVVSTALSALVHFAREGFGALIPLAWGLFTMAVLSYQLRAQGTGGSGRTGDQLTRKESSGTC